MFKLIEGKTTIDIDERAYTHPCYSKSASHQFARMHLPVAPACNIQCNYCSRLFDCANENRPGVSSSILSADEALNRVRTVFRQMPNLSVIGIAGPGDALATPGQTFKTLENIRSEFPGMKLCLATNGLALPDNIDALTDLNIEFVTVTVNAIDPSIGSQVYSWVNDSGEIHYGEKGANLLWSRQRAGIKELSDSGVLVKINTVLIPGINNRHVTDIAREVKELGAYILNVIPMMPVHSSVFSSLEPPSPDEYNDVLNACSPYIYIMRHCRRCRADATGMLEERGKQNAS